MNFLKHPHVVFPLCFTHGSFCLLPIPILSHPLPKEVPAPGRGGDLSGKIQHSEHNLYLSYLLTHVFLSPGIRMCLSHHYVPSSWYNDTLHLFALIWINQAA